MIDKYMPLSFKLPFTDHKKNSINSIGGQQQVKIPVATLDLR